MLGVTTVLTSEIPPIPMFWILPLATYPLSFILVFAKKPLISHSQFAERMPVVILAGIIPLLIKASWPLFLEIAVLNSTAQSIGTPCRRKSRSFQKA